MEISKEVKRFGARDIIYVELEKERQPFYRSTGESSGMPGEWLPFDGIGSIWSLWFDKAQYCFPNAVFKERYGTEELYNISQQLSLLNIPKGEITDPEVINTWLSTRSSLEWNKNIDWEGWRKSERFKKWMQ